MITKEITDKSDIKEYALIYVLCSFLRDYNHTNLERTIEILCDFIEYDKVQNVEHYNEKYKAKLSIDEIHLVNKLQRLSENIPYSFTFLEEEFSSNFEEEEVENWFNPQNSNVLTPDDVPKAKQCIFFQTIRIINQAYGANLALTNRLLKLITNGNILGESIHFDIKNYDNNDLLSSYVYSFFEENLITFTDEAEHMLLPNLLKTGLYINSVDHQQSNLALELIEAGKNPLLILFLFQHFGLNIYQKNKAGKCAYDWLNSNNWIISKNQNWGADEEKRLAQIKLDNAAVQLLHTHGESYLKGIEDITENSFEMLEKINKQYKNQNFLKLGSQMVESLNLSFFEQNHINSSWLEDKSITNHLDKALLSSLDRDKHLRAAQDYSYSKFKIYKDVSKELVSETIKSGEALSFMYYNTHISDSQFLELSKSVVSKNIEEKYNGHNALSLAIMQKRWVALADLLGRDEVKEFLSRHWPDFSYTIIKKVPNFIDYFKAQPYLIDMKNSDGNTILHICAKHHLNNVLAQIISVTPTDMIYQQNSEGYTFMNYIEGNKQTTPEDMSQCISFFSKAVLEGQIKTRSVPISTNRYKI